MNQHLCLCLCLFVFVCMCLCGGIRERTKPELSADEKVKRAFYLTQRYADQVSEYKHTLKIWTKGSELIIKQCMKNQRCTV